MNLTARSIRTFIGAKEFNASREFYQLLGFAEVVIDASMSLFKVNEQIGFYLQNAYVKDWVDNSMIFLEVADLDACHATLLEKKLTEKFKKVRISSIKNEAWGREFFVHDPSGVLWHFGKFNN